MSTQARPQCMHFVCTEKTSKMAKTFKDSLNKFMNLWRKPLRSTLLGKIDITHTSQHSFVHFKKEIMSLTTIFLFFQDEIEDTHAINILVVLFCLSQQMVYHWKIVDGGLSTISCILILKMKSEVLWQSLRVHRMEVCSKVLYVTFDRKPY